MQPLRNDENSNLKGEQDQNKHVKNRINSVYLQKKNQKGVSEGPFLSFRVQLKLSSTLHGRRRSRGHPPCPQSHMTQLSE